MTQLGFFAKLENRGRITISGPTAQEFLQGLTTADINALGPANPLLYSCLLTPNGKFLHDFFISRQESAFVLDCEGGDRANHLAKILSVYKLRAQIDIQCQPQAEVFAIIAVPEAPGLRDPRHPDMGYRSSGKPENISQAPFPEWDRHRINLLVPDGSRDMLPERATLLEFGLDRLNAVSFDKGCYLGQELTARMHYRGLAKKHLRKLSGANLPERGAALYSADGKLVGEMGSSCGDIGLALIKKDYAGEDLKTESGLMEIKILLK